MVRLMNNKNLSTVIIDKIYIDTIDLLKRSQQYLEQHSKQKYTMNPLNNLIINSEMTRVTARLTQVMAWILAQKAALSGEIDFAEANSEKFRPPADLVCLYDSSEGMNKKLPVILSILLNESLSLYERVLHLSQQNMKKTISSSQNPDNEI